MLSLHAVDDNWVNSVCRGRSCDLIKICILLLYGPNSLDGFMQVIFMFLAQILSFTMRSPSMKILSYNQEPMTPQAENFLFLFFGASISAYSS